MSDHFEPVALADEAIAELERSLSGTALGPDDPNYESARVCFNALVDRRPAVIAQCLGPDDIATAFDFGRVHRLQVACAAGATTLRATASSREDS